ncbi:hypothetical protein PBY51_018370 [Eleginops maclovinus]|uniref:Uncharacterized protein n=1 Tax=Eleginops maclovinus TaxID=56733 RepID=A0AAN7Y397_ELEMC|nr:hypothetical protein PBY51_018370 [Eleginops maclovinus]
MTETTIQLPEVSAATVTQWFSRRCRSQEHQILKQGIPAPDPPMAGPEKLPVAMQKGPSLCPGSVAQPHIFVLPPNTAGEAKLKKGSRPLALCRSHHHLHTMDVPSLHQHHHSQFPIWYLLCLDPHRLRLEAHRWCFSTCLQLLLRR